MIGVDFVEILRNGRGFLPRFFLGNLAIAICVNALEKLVDFGVDIFRFFTHGFFGSQGQTG
jgi:hypothetical protein